MLRSVHQPYFKAETFQDAKWLLFFSMIIHAKLITCKVSFVTDPSLTWTCVITRKIVWCRTEVHPFEQKNQRMEEAFKQFAKWSENISGWILSRNRIFLQPFFSTLFIDFCKRFYVSLKWSFRSVLFVLEAERLFRVFSFPDARIIVFK